MPVYVSNEDYAAKGSAPAEEKAERQRIYREAAKAGLSSGTVHVYILDPAGKCIDSQHVATASKVENLTAMLERTVAKLKPVASAALAPPVPQSCPTHTSPDSLMLHLTARHLVRKGNTVSVPTVKLGENRSGSWGAYPGENWIELPKSTWTKFLPASAPKEGTSWTIDADAASQILVYFYPPTENNDVRKNEIRGLTLTATALTSRDGILTARLDGRLSMKHPFYHKDDNKMVETDLLGFIQYDLTSKTIQSIQVVTDGGTYGKQPFGAVARSVK